MEFSCPLHQQRADPVYAVFLIANPLKLVGDAWVSPQIKKADTLAIKRHRTVTLANQVVGASDGAGPVGD
jgi:hypothetical protein